MRNFRKSSVKKVVLRACMSRVDRTSLWRLYSSKVQYTTVSGVSRLHSELKSVVFRLWQYQKIVMLISHTCFPDADQIKAPRLGVSPGYISTKLDGL